MKISNRKILGCFVLSLLVSSGSLFCGEPEAELVEIYDEKVLLQGETLLDITEEALREIVSKATQEEKKYLLLTLEDRENRLRQGYAMGNVCCLLYGYAFPEQSEPYYLSMMSQVTMVGGVLRS